MYYDGSSDKGACPASVAEGPTGLAISGHVAQGYNFELSYDYPEFATAQTAWRWCDKCGVMFYDGFPDKGHCIAGGGHEPVGTGNTFTLPHDIAETPFAQPQWRFCDLCHAMFFDGYADKGLCAGNQVGSSIGPTDIHRIPKFAGHHSSGFTFVLPHDLPAPPPGPPSGDSPKVVVQGPVWVVSLTHQQSEALQGTFAAIAGAIGVAMAPLVEAPPVALAVAIVEGALGTAIGVIQCMDALGGDQGVDVQGVIGTAGVMVTPHGTGVFQTLVQGAEVARSVATIADYVLLSSSRVPSIADAFGTQTAAAVVTAMANGTPLGWALAAAFGVVVDLLEPAPDPNAHGGVHADRPQAADWEQFLLFQIPPGNQIALLSWQGLFSAQGGGGGDVYANRPQLGPWETWTLLDNQDGSVSFQTNNGHYLTALNGGGPGSYCLTNATAIGSSERFTMTPLPNGRVSIQTRLHNMYLSVQPGK
jgi:hypothetical protein